MCKEHHGCACCCCNDDNPFENCHDHDHSHNDPHHHHHDHEDGQCCHHHDHEHEHAHDHHHDSTPHMWVIMGISIILLVWGLIANPLPEYEWAIFVCAYFPIGLPILKAAYGEIRHGDIFNEFTLMIIATIGAFAIGEYPEAIAVLLFYSIGEYFQGRAVGRARRDIKALVNLRPDKAVVVDENGKRTETAPESVQPGAIIEVKAGGRIPLDGTLLTEHADFDTAALTGESMPRSLKTNDEVLAGMIALSHVVRIKVSRPATESALQRILNMVQDAARHKAPAEMFIRRFARVYTPTVIALAAGIALIPPLISGTGWSEWLYRALVFLVISCPCALVVSVPLCYFRGIGVASRHGILFKGGNYLDAITRIRQVVFDKTGTLTSGKFGVVRVDTHNGFSKNEVLGYAAAVERFSTHPIAQAIACHAEALETAEAAGIEETSGKGLRGTVNGKEVIAGHPDFLRQLHIEVPARLETEEAYTCVYCAIDGKLAGVIALCDEAKAEAAEAVERLHKLNIDNVCILSGDREPVVKALAQELGVDEYHGALLPEDKARLFSEIKKRNPEGHVAFVGDGINDAPVLALSDVGIAMGGGGADAAVETADVVIQTDNPSRVADALLIGRHTRHIVQLNITLAIGVKVIVLIAGALGFTSLWAAVLADTGVALLCVANTYLIRR